MNKRYLDQLGHYQRASIDTRKTTPLTEKLSPEQLRVLGAVVDTMPLNDQEKRILKTMTVQELISLFDILSLQELNQAEVIRDGGKTYIVYPIPVGFGGLGQVYKAFDIQLTRSVAIKTVIVDSAEQFQALQREAQAHANEEHPNIARVYDFIPKASQVTLPGLQNKPLFIMEYFNDVESSTLSDLPSPNPEIAIKIVEQLCSALEFMADPRPRPLRFGTKIEKKLNMKNRPLFHADLKPENIFIDGQGNVKITDFGIATTVHDHNKELSGTAQYVSPELIKRLERDIRSELFSLTSVLYTVLTEKKFYAPNTTDFLETLQAIVIQKFESIDEPLSQYCNKHGLNKKTVEDFFIKAWKKNPEDRFQDPKEYAAAFKKAFTK